MEKRSVDNNNFGVTAVVFGILSIVFSLVFPIFGIVFGVISLIFAIKQKKINKNSWSKAGMILSIIGILLSLIIWIVTIVLLAPQLNELLQQYQPAG